MKRYWNMKIFLLMMLAAVQGDASHGDNLPTGCDRVKDVVICKNLRTFPTTLATDAKTVTIGQSDFDEIPSHAFIGLSEVSNLTLYLLNVKTIKSCAFSNIPTLNFLDVMFSDVATIESDAFGNITRLAGGKLSIFMLIIGVIRPYAFSNIEGFTLVSFDLVRIRTLMSYAFDSIVPKVTITRTNITTVAPGAFQKIVTGVVLHTLTIYKLGCHTFDALHLDLGNRFHLSSVNISCHCDLSWFVSVVRETPAIGGHDVACFDVDNLKVITNLSDVTEEQLCGGSRPVTCSPYGVAPPVVVDMCRISGASYQHISYVVFIFVPVAVVACLG